MNALKTALYFILSALLIVSQDLIASPENTPYQVYIVPQLSPLVTYQAWTPILEKLAEKTGLKFELIVPPNIPDFEKDVNNGLPDLAFMNPYHMTIAKHRQGYIPLVRDSANLLEGNIVVQKDNPIKSINELKNQTIAFPAPNAFAATLLIRSLLVKQNIPITPLYANTHSNVYRTVALGDVLAGGGIKNTFTREPLDIQQQLRVLYTTPRYAPHPLAAHPRIPIKIRQEISAAFIKLANDSTNKEIFVSIQMTKPIEANYQKDYKVIEKLKFETTLTREKK